MNSRERVFAHLDGKPVDCFPCLPITMMFAADLIGRRYLDYATDYRVLAEGQLRVAETFDFDYVNTMSDPAVEASDCGAAIKYYPGQPPAIDEANALLRDKSQLAKLKIPEPAKSRRMSNRIQAVALLKQRVGGDKMVEGWIEGPCAEGADLRGINNLMLDFFDDPGFIRDLFEFVVQMELEFAKAQVAAGAEVIGIGDAAASLVGPKFYDEFVWPYEKKMVDGVHALGARTRLHICGNTRPLLEGMGRLRCSFVELDSLAPMSEGREKMGPAQVLLGNIDPVRVLRAGTPAAIYEAVGECHRQAGNRFMVGAGCEVPRDTAPANLKALVRYSREHSPA